LLTSSITSPPLPPPIIADRDLRGKLSRIGLVEASPSAISLVETKTKLRPEAGQRKKKKVATYIAKRPSGIFGLFCLLHT
jgi:hypothetical protein